MSRCIAHVNDGVDDHDIVDDKMVFGRKPTTAVYKSSVTCVLAPVCGESR